jgi:hypothetical protein
MYDWITRLLETSIPLVLFGLWYLTPLLTIFQLYYGGQVYWYEALDRFTKAFNGPVFDDIIKSAHTDKVNRIYFDDFLGDRDFTITGSPIVSIMTS